MYQSDLTFIEEGNPNMLRDTDPPVTRNATRIGSCFVHAVDQLSQKETYCTGVARRNKSGAFVLACAAVR
jgi:hypothetical protein